MCGREGGKIWYIGIWQGLKQNAVETAVVSPGSGENAAFSLEKVEKEIAWQKGQMQGILRGERCILP
jgi:hypothetical protein